MRGFGELASKTWKSLEVPRDLFLGRYPAFVTGGPLRKGDIPVFVFHSLEPEDFSRKLEHLQRNGYVTLSGTEYHQILLEKARAPEKAVLLTFDDGRASLRTVGLPLMRRYGARGLAFLVPGRIPSRPGLPPVFPEGDHLRDNGEDPFLSWEELLDLKRSGLFEFGSHTLSHSRVHVSREVVGFMRPGFGKGLEAMDVPWIRESDRDLLASEIPLGTPLFRSLPRTSEAYRFFESEGLREACRKVVREEGCLAFFDRSGWEKDLRSHVGPVHGRLETDAERVESLSKELRESRSLIESHTGTLPVHLCFPWHASGPTSRRLAQAAGYETAFVGKVRGTPITHSGDDFLKIARIGEDYLELLPGQGRETLRRVLTGKWSRRRRGGKIS